MRNVPTKDLLPSQCRQLKTTHVLEGGMSDSQNGGIAWIAHQRLHQLVIKHIEGIPTISPAQHLLMVKTCLQAIVNYRPIGFWQLGQDDTNRINISGHVFVRHMHASRIGHFDHIIGHNGRSQW